MASKEDYPEAALAFEAALAEVGIRIMWDNGVWVVNESADPRVCWKANELAAQFIDQEPMTYQQWAEWLLENPDRSSDPHQLARWLARGLP